MSRAHIALRDVPHRFDDRGVAHGQVASRGKLLHRSPTRCALASLVGILAISLGVLFETHVAAAPPPPAPPPPPPVKGPPGQQPPVKPPPFQRPPGQRPPVPTVEDLGQALFFDTTLSNPVGQACASCHAPQVGFTYPESDENLEAGPVEGAVSGRFGNRKPPTISYAALLPTGPPAFNSNFGTYVGGLFWDGRAANLVAQAAMPLQNPNEMNDLVHNVGSPALVVQKVLNGPWAQMFIEVYGNAVLTEPTSEVFELICEAIAAFEQSSAVSPFSSKYDAALAGRAMLTASELNGLRLFTGSTTGRPGGTANKSALCFFCHTVNSSAAAGPDLFTNSTFTNTGVPKNTNNPYYTETNSTTDPVGYNSLGAAYVDYGLGDFLYPQMQLPSGNIGSGSNGQGDFLAINGTFKAPTLRNVDKRPSPGFIKAYGHNGYFKSLKQVVHFYNVRNLTTVAGEVIDFTKAQPYAAIRGKPLFPTPENPSPVTLINPSGAAGSIGNLGLTAQEENDIVNFLGTLSDQ